jgi:hypothetical protein
VKTKLSIVLLGLLVSGCASTPQFITKEKLTVLEPDRSLYNCPNVSKYPNSDTLTDVQVARLLLSYERSNAECRRNMKAIQSFIDSAKARAEQSN